MTGRRLDIVFPTDRRIGIGCLVILGMMMLWRADSALGQGHAMGRITGGVERIQTERGISGRFQSSRLTLDPAEYEGMYSFPNLGLLRVLPNYQFMAAYTDNVFLQKQRNSDWVFANSPGIIVDLEGRQHLLELVYGADIITAARFGVFDRAEHEFDARLSITPTRFLTLRTENDFTSKYVTPQFLGDDKKHFLADTVSVGASYQFFKRSSIDLTYQYDTVRFSDSEFKSSDYSANTIDLDLYYRILPKTRLFSEFTVSFVDNANVIVEAPGEENLSTDNVRYQISGGGYWDPTARLRGRIQGGYEWVDYIDLPLSKGPFFSGELEYDYSRRLRFGLRLLNTITEGSPVTNTIQDGLNFQTTDVALRATYTVIRNLDWHAEGFLIIDNYGYEKDPTSPVPQSNRKDTTVGVETGLDWRIMRNAMVGISYQFQNNTSKGAPPAGDPTFSINDFRENLLSLYLSLVF